MSSPQFSTGLLLRPDLPMCQTEFPLDWYQEEFKPYAEEFQALPDRLPGTVFKWLDSYVTPALDHFGDSLLLLAHFYMGGEIVKLVERYGGSVSDSYALSLKAREAPEKKVIVESAVHFMAESIALLAHDDQDVWITNPKAGCTMEMLAKDYMVLPVFDQLEERFGDDLLVISYMNTSGRIKAIAGRTGGAVCTSSNAHLVVKWARKKGKKILFVPDQHLGRNTAAKLGMDLNKLHLLPDPQSGAIHLDSREMDRIADSEMILWGSSCGVHTISSGDMVRWWQERGWTTLIHPESPLDAVTAADGAGSTDFLWKAVQNAKPGSKLAIGTEGHFVRNAAELGKQNNVEVVHIADLPHDAVDSKGKPFASAGCGCATMSRNDPPHLAGILDLLRKGEAPEINKVYAGDSIDEITMRRERLAASEREELIQYARLSMERMIEIVNAG